MKLSSHGEQRYFAEDLKNSRPNYVFQHINIHTKFVKVSINREHPKMY